MKAEADRSGLCSRSREAPDGTDRGGGGFDRGHIHRILTNPVYAGRIRHRDRVYEGQHAPIIDPERWQPIQPRLQDGAARSRSTASSPRRSLLCGKLHDEARDRLTPSHTTTRNGSRLRYYISHRLAARSSEQHPGAWRLPAEDLEQQIADLVRATLARQGFTASIVSGASAEIIGRVSSALGTLLTDPSTEELLSLVERADISPGTIRLHISAHHLAERLAFDIDALDVERLGTSQPFQLRKRGVETRIVLADMPTGQDEALIRNIARAHAWLARIKAGEAFAQLSDTEGTPKRRIQQMIDLAFLAPITIRDVMDGKQPLGFTSDWCLRHDLPSDWQDQRALLATL